MTPSPTRDTRAGYLLAVGSVSLALLTTWLAWPFLSRTPFFLLFVATMAGAHWAGERAGLVTIPLAAVGHAIFFGNEFPVAFTTRGLTVFVVLALGANRLIVSRKRTEAALRASEAQFRAGWEHAAVGAALLTRDGTLIRINPAFARILDCGKQNCTGTRFLDFTHPDDRHAEQALFAELAEGRRDDYRREQRYRTHDGTVIWGRVVTSLIRAGDGRPTGALLMLEDITDRKALEDQVRQMQKLDAMGRLVAGVAHDFNNFLTAIGGYTELAIREIEHQSPARRDLEEVLRVSHRAAALTRQLLIFSRQPTLDPQPLNLDGVIAALDSLLRQLLGEHLRIATALKTGTTRVRLDPGHLEQIVVNLAVNARDAMPHGGTLTVETSLVDLDDTYAVDKPARPPSGSYVLLTVSDTGCGMDENVKARLFEPFFTTKDAGKGTGLGLATVYGIVKQCGGYIWVYSEPGHGTSFKIYFPQVPPAGEPLLRVPTRPAGVAAQKTVLVVEDEPSVRALTCAILRKEGYEVLDAESGEQALALSATHTGSIHVIVSDVAMPGMGGVEVVRHVRGRHPDARVLHLSGFSELVLGSQGVLDAESSFLPKPFTRQQLVAKVQGLLDEPHPESARLKNSV